MTASLRLVVFDMDGTLINSAAFIEQAMGRVCEQAGFCAPSGAAVRAIIGLSLPEAFGVLLPETGYAEQERLAGLYRETIVAMRMQASDGAPLYAGARQVLDQLQARDEVLLGIATGKALRGVRHAFAEHDIGGYFHTVQGADGHPSKPHPSMLEQCMRDTGVDAAQAVIVGDTSFDMAMGRAAGFLCVGVRWGYHSDAVLKQTGAHVLVDSFADLIPAIDDLWRTV
jgi:phosphoglycolate phosphatase